MRRSPPASLLAALLFACSVQGLPRISPDSSRDQLFSWICAKPGEPHTTLCHLEELRKKLTPRPRAWTEEQKKVSGELRAKMKAYPNHGRDLGGLISEWCEIDDHIDTKTCAPHKAAKEKSALFRELCVDGGPQGLLARLWRLGLLKRRADASGFWCRKASDVAELKKMPRLTGLSTLEASQASEARKKVFARLHAVNKEAKTQGKDAMAKDFNALRTRFCALPGKDGFDLCKNGHKNEDSYYSYDE